MARPLDLTQNIFQDGQWGTLRQARFPEVFWVPQPESPCGLSSAIQHALCMCSFHQQHAFPISSPYQCSRGQFWRLSTRLPSLLDIMQAPQLCLSNLGSQSCPRGLPAALPGCRTIDLPEDRSSALLATSLDGPWMPY